MEIKSTIKKCDYCKREANSLCYECLFYFCDSCFNIAHNIEENKSHKKEKVDYFVPIDLRCPKHKYSPMNLFCSDEKGN